MKSGRNHNWSADNGAFPLVSDETERYISVVPSPSQLAKAEKPYYCFIHFGMNTATGREWGNGSETAADFKIKNVDARQWARTVKKSGATGIILTCKHHDGFCLWNTKTTDFSVMKSAFGRDIVRLVSEACREYSLDFGVYLSPWDMHEGCYGTEEYNDFYCAQLTELLTDYGKIFEVWLDGAKGSGAKKFDYDWERYYSLIRSLQPEAQIAVCGPDVRWIGNENATPRKSEYCVVPEYLTMCEARKDVPTPQKSQDDDLGSRAVLEAADRLKWYPAEADISIRKGWFYPGGGELKSAKKLFEIYLDTVGANAFLLLNVPPTADGVIDSQDAEILSSLGNMIKSLREKPAATLNPGRLSEDNPDVGVTFEKEEKLRYCELREDISHSQRVERFELYLINRRGDYSLAYSGTVIGMRRIIPLGGVTAVGARLVIRQSRGIPYIREISFFK